MELWSEDRKFATKLQTHMRSHTFYAFEAISVISILSAFKLACDTNGVDKGASKSLFHFFMKRSFPAALKVRLFLPMKTSSNVHRAKEGMLRTFTEMVNDLLQNYDTDDVIAKTDAAISLCTESWLCHWDDMQMLWVRNCLRAGSHTMSRF